jgi:sugar-specific transcriptional regulator TrmB
MMEAEAELETYLHEMGLSAYETKAYLAVLRQGILTASAATESTDIPQSRIYDVFDSLERKGFVKVQQGRPKKYGAIEPETAVQQYCEYRRDEFEAELSKTRSAGEALVEEFEPRQQGTNGHDDIDIFWSYAGKNRLLSHFGNLCREAETEILMLTEAYSFERVVASHKEVLADRATDGVDIRVLVSEADALDPDVWETAREWSTVVPAPGIAGHVYLIDGTKVFVAFRNDADTQYVGVVMNSTDLYETLSGFFALMWEHHAHEPVAERT